MSQASKGESLRMACPSHAERSLVPSCKPSERLLSAFAAAQEGRLTPERVQRMQDGGENLLQPDDDGRALICVAAESRNWMSVERLAALGGGIADTIDSAGLAPLHYAAQAGAASTVRALLNAGASPFLKDRNGRTPGEHAATSDDLPTLQALHSWIRFNYRSAGSGGGGGAGSSAGALGPAAPRLLHAAAAAGSNDILSWILKAADLDVNIGVVAAASGNVHTAMTRAAIAGRLETVKLLVSTHRACIKPSADAPTAVSALHAAAEAGRADVVSWLLQRAPGLITLKDFRGYGLMHAAAAGGDVPTLRLIMEALRKRGGKNVNVVINWRSQLPAEVRATKAAAAAAEARKAKAARDAAAAAAAAAGAPGAVTAAADGASTFAGTGTGAAAPAAGLARNMSEDQDGGDGGGLPGHGGVDTVSGGAEIDAIAHEGEEDEKEHDEDEDGYAPTFSFAAPEAKAKVQAKTKAKGKGKAVAPAIVPKPSSCHSQPGPPPSRSSAAAAAARKAIKAAPARAAGAGAAAGYGDPDDVDTASPISLDGRGPLGWTPLALAVTCGKHAAAQALLDEAGAKVDALAPGGADGETHWPPLFFAAENNDVAMIDMLLRAGASVTVRDADLRTAAHIAAAAGGAATLAALADAMDVDLFMARDARQATVLHEAAKAGSGEAMSTILARCRMHERARASDEDIAGRSPLSIAKAGGHAAVVRVLRAML